MVQAGVSRVGDGANIEHAIFRLLRGDERLSALPNASALPVAGHFLSIMATAGVATRDVV
jgi:hypothetical protein